MKISPTQRIIIGLSPGRTGSKSIAHILGHQHKSSSNHEHGPKLPYIKDMDLFHENVSSFLDKFKDSKYICFNGFFYTWYLDDLLKLFPEARVYVLTRDIEETVKSHYNKVTKHVVGKTMYKNYWNMQDRGRCKSDWEVCFPQVSKGLSLKDGIRKYVNDYWDLINEKLIKYQAPGNYRMRAYNIEGLNREDHLLDLLRFLRIDDEDIRLPKQKVQIVNRWYEVRPKRGGKDIKFEGL